MDRGTVVRPDSRESGRPNALPPSDANSREWAGARLVVSTAPPAWESTELQCRSEPRCWRLTTNETGFTAFETSVAQYLSKDGSLAIDVVSAVHIAERSYYEALNERFKRYDRVLYEWVAGVNRRTATAEESPDGTPLFHDALRDITGLELQLDVVDYRAKNFRHADMTHEELDQALTDKGLRFTSMMSQGLMSYTALIDQLREFGRENGSSWLKTLIAQFFMTVPKATGLAQQLDEVIVNRRNDAALRVLDGELSGLLSESGRATQDNPIKVALFYGGVHGADFHLRLTRDYGLDYQGEEFVEAWDLRSGAGAAPIESDHDNRSADLDGEYPMREGG